MKKLFFVLIFFLPQFVFSKTISENKSQSLFHYLLYERYFSQGNYLDGISELEKAISLDENSIFLREEILPIYFDLGDYDKTLKTAKRLLALTGENFSAYYYMASVYEIRGDPIKAEEFYRKALKIKPSSADAYFALGRIYMKKKNYEKAEESFKQAVLNDPENTFIRLTLALLYEAQGKFSLALDEYLAIKNITPTPATYLKIGEIYLKLKKESLAEKAFKEVLKIDSENLSALLALAGIYEGKNQWDKVKDTLLQFHIVRDDYPEIELYLGVAYMKLGNFKKAEDFFKRAEELAKDNPYIYRTLAYICTDAGKFEKALKCTDKLIELEGENTENCFMKGVCLDSLGQKQQAYEYFEHMSILRKQ